MSMYETVVFERVRGRTESGAPPGSPGRRVGGSAVQRFSGSTDSSDCQTTRCRP
ncbi:hypothetical protein DM75_3579 [Burkholderia mallei]|nr:hypothetical protein DM75_3579 [Burkholderia mallei]